MRRLAFLSARYWRARPARTATTVAGVAIGVALVVAVGLINDGILRGYESLSTALAGRADLEVRARHPTGMDVRWLRRVQAVEGVQAAVPLLEERSFLFLDDRLTAVRVRGVDAARDRVVRPPAVVEGRALAPEDGAAILLAASLAEAVGARVGDEVQLLAPEGLEPFRVVGVFGGADAFDAPGARVAVVPLPALQEAYLGGRAAFGQIDAMLEPDADPAAVQARLEAVVGGVAFVERPPERAARVAELTRGVRFVLLLASAMSLVAASYLIANNVLAAVRERQRDLAVLRALGMGRRTVAAWLLIEVVAMAAVGSLAGVAAGGGAAGVLARAVSGRLVAPVDLDVALLVPSPAPAPLVLLAGFATGVLAALFAALPAVRWSASQELPAALGWARAEASGAGDALALPGPPAPRRRAVVLGLIGSTAAAVALHALAPTRAWSFASVLLALAALVGAASNLPVLMALLGSRLRSHPSSPLWLRLAADGLQRDRRRAGAVAASLTITLAILVGVFGMVHAYRGGVAAWIEARVGWDLMVSNGSDGLRADVPLAESVGTRLAGIEGVAEVAAERVALVAHGPHAVTLRAVDGNGLERMRRLEVERGPDADALPGLLADGRRVAVSTTLAAREGLDPGDGIELGTADGPVAFEVLAVVRDPSDPQGSAWIDRATYAELWHDRSVDAYAVRLEPGADADAVAEEARLLYGERRPLRVTSAARFKADLERVVGETFGLSQGLVLMAVLMALFGLLNAGMIGVWQLRRQLAVLRALGAPVGLLSRALLAEAWLTGAAGGVVGVVMGTLLSGALLRTVQSASELAVQWTWPVGAWALAAAIALLGSLAAGWPSSRAVGRVGVLEALRSD